jgi:hypothetical protein
VIYLPMPKEKMMWGTHESSRKEREREKKTRKSKC